MAVRIGSLADIERMKETRGLDDVIDVFTLEVTPDYSCTRVRETKDCILSRLRVC